MSITMEVVKDIHEANEKHYKEMFRLDIVLIVLIIVVAIPCCIFSGTMGFINKDVFTIVLNTLLFALNAYNGVTTVKRMIRRYKNRKEEN